MLVKAKFQPACRAPRSRQRGVVMLVALVVLVVMTLAGIGLMRSMDTTNLIAGNMAFKQSATQSSDTGVETAIGWLEANNNLGILDSDRLEVGYRASSLSNADLGLGQAFWDGLAPSPLVPSGFAVCNLPIAGGVCSATAAPNAAGNRISFMIQRLCAAPGSRNDAATACSVVTGAVDKSGNSEGASDEGITTSGAAVYYRITVRVVGPRNAVSFVQAIVAL